MAKVFAILMMVAGIWVGVELFTEGRAGAFGGRLAPLFGMDETEIAQDAPLGHRAGGSVAEAHRDSENRLDRLLTGE